MGNCLFCGKQTNNLMLSDKKLGESYVCDSCNALLKDEQFGRTFIRNYLFNTLPTTMPNAIKSILVDSMLEEIDEKLNTDK